MNPSLENGLLTTHRSMTFADRSRELGWKPTKTEDDWNNSIRENFQQVLEESKTRRRKSWGLPTDADLC